jgi:hypothetical protein
MAAPGGTLVSLLFVVQLENVIKTTLVGHDLPGNVAHRLRHIQKKTMRKMSTFLPAVSEEIRQITRGRYRNNI